MSFEPDILGFACNWCGYAGADGAGLAKLQYPANIKIVRLMCLGRTEPNFILNAFEQGYDGVILFGCHIGDCHYVSGNIQAEQIIVDMKKLLDTLGLRGERLRREETSSAEGTLLANLVHSFRDDLVQMGPSPLKKEAGQLSQVQLTR
ncbi:MAG: hydrogenase iron-sulfur subunit [Pseudomonadales bacterium]|jgi:F420-non-reducing hydrogenase iron-sulfur subunit|nr:hydrogenase iron-sulfur subunit [Pseudomonadales bacterium]MDP7359047.1 hydrogenase iron-sulfur subunit [Pseudomonadales bacterium]HJN52158.1 hydrogenase iron-sulfur subunit [Pseudomonadales bacterium]|tara:strand:- start:878 stop:1321 length:444 start_codon:yes stop_codon:yes gene_type:complete